MKKYLGFLLLIPLLFTGCGRSSLDTVRTDDGRELTRVVLQTDWFAQPEHGGFYQAYTQGYFEEVGLYVEINQGGPNALTSQRVVRDIAQFGINRSDDILVQRGQGLPLVIVGAMMQADPQGILFHEEDNIEGFEDLDGRTIMAGPGATFIEMIQRQFDISVNIRPLTYGMEQFLANNRFIQQCFITNEPFYAKLHGANPGVLHVADSGFNPYRVIFTSEAMLENHPEIVERFVAASMRGWHSYMTGDRSAADAMIAERHDKMRDANFRDFSVSQMLYYQLIHGDPEQGEFLGNLKRERFETEVDQLYSIQLINRQIPVDEFVRFDFIPAPDAFPHPLRVERD